MEIKAEGSFSGSLWPACRRKNFHAPKAQSDGRTRGRPNPQAAPKSLATTSSRSELDCLLPFWGDPLMGCFLLECSSFFFLCMPKSTWPPCDRTERITLSVCRASHVSCAALGMAIRKCPRGSSDYSEQIYSGCLKYYQSCYGRQKYSSSHQASKNLHNMAPQFLQQGFLSPCVTPHFQVFQDRCGNCPLGSGPTQ